MSRPISVALVDGAIGSAITEAAEVSWARLARRLTWPSKQEDDQKLGAPAWLPVRLVDGAPMVRKDSHVAAVSCLVLDIDEGVRWFDVWARVEALGLACVMHSTWSHTREHHKARVVFPFAEDCPRSQWLEVWACAEVWAKGWGASIDPACKNPSRLYFLPALPATGWDDKILAFKQEQFGGDWLHWRTLLADHRPPVVAPLPLRPVGPSWVSSRHGAIDREEGKRRAFALGVLRRRCSQIVEGQGRNQRAYTGGRAVGQLSAAGVLSEGEGYDALMTAATGAGLKQTEADRAIRNGINKGIGDGPWDFSTN